MRTLRKLIEMRKDLDKCPSLKTRYQKQLDLIDRQLLEIAAEASDMVVADENDKWVMVEVMSVKVSEIENILEKMETDGRVYQLQ